MTPRRLLAIALSVATGALTACGSDGGPGGGSDGGSGGGSDRVSAPEPVDADDVPSFVLDTVSAIEAVEAELGAGQRYFEVTGWRRSPGLVRTIPEVVPVFTDGATLSPSSVLVQVSGWLAKQLGDDEWAAQVERAGHAGLDQLADDPYWYVGQLLLLMEAGGLQ